MNNPVAPVVIDEMVLTANLEVDRLEKELDITNADHIALWLASAGKMPISFLACRIADAYDRARDGELERLRAALSRMLLEFDFMIDANMIADVRNDVIFVEARAALEGSAV